jgi:MoxR-like ATPase
VALAHAGQAHAAALGRPYVNADDIKRLAPFVLGHRLLVRPEAELTGARSVDLLDRILAAVPVPGLAAQRQAPTWPPQPRVSPR